MRNRLGNRSAFTRAVALACTLAACSELSGSGSATAVDGQKLPRGDAGDGGPAAACSRESLTAVVNDYFAALSARDPSRLPLSEDVKFTENTKRLPIGEGLWQKAGAVAFTRSAYDVQRCASHTQAVIDEAGESVLFGVRLAVPGGEISEIETYIAREGDYPFFSVEGLLQSESFADTDVRWEALVPEDKRSGRAELIKIADLYFNSFGEDGYQAPMYRDCYRWEDGVRTTFGDCSVGLPWAGMSSGEIHTHRRYSVVDEEAGIVVGYVLFGGTVHDFHMFKIIDGEIRLIQAVVGTPGYETSGWDELEEDIPDVEVDSDPDGLRAAMCAGVNLAGNINAGGYGTCEAAETVCSSGTMADLVAAAGSPLALTALGARVGRDCESGLTCCLAADACESLSETVAGLVSLVGISLPPLACQATPCEGVADVATAAFGCPSGQYCCPAR